MPLGTVDSTLVLGSAIYAVMAPPLGSAFYYMLAPQNTLPPYTVYQFLTDVDEYSFNTSWQEIQVQVKTVSNQRWPTDAQRIYSNTVHPTMQDAALSVSGFQVLQVRRMHQLYYQDNEFFFHVGGIYGITLQKT